MGKIIFCVIIGVICSDWKEKTKFIPHSIFQKRGNLFVLSYLFLLLVAVFPAIHCGNEETYIKELKTIPGDNKILLQWEITLDPHDVFGIKIARSNDKHNWIYVDQDTATYFNYFLGRYIDTQVQNGEKYYYKVRPGSFEGFLGDYSKIVEATPRAGLPDPLPLPVANLQTNNLGDSIEISWDSYPTRLYFIAQTNDTLQPLNAWNLPFVPDTISNCKFRIKNQKDGRTVYYVIVPFPDCILGKASQKLLVKHE